MGINRLFCKLDDVIRKTKSISEVAGFVEGATSYFRNIFDAKIIYDVDANLEENPNLDFDAVTRGESQEPLMAASDYPQDLLLGFDKFIGLNPKLKDADKGFVPYGTRLCAGLQGVAESLIKPGVAREKLFTQLFNGLDKVYRLLMKYEKMEVQFDTVTNGAGLIAFDQAMEAVNTESLNFAQIGQGREVEVGDLIDTLTSDGKSLQGLAVRKIDNERVIVYNIVESGYHQCEIAESKILDPKLLNAIGLRNARMEFYDNIICSN